VHRHAMIGGELHNFGVDYARWAILHSTMANAGITSQDIR